MEKEIIKLYSCYICKVKTNKIHILKCEHIICEKCIYILILYNKNSLEQFINNIFEEELEINCICQNGFIKLIYSKANDDFIFFDEDDVKIDKIKIDFKKEKYDIHSKFKNGLKLLNQLNSQVIIDKKNDKDVKEILNDNIECENKISIDYPNNRINPDIKINNEEKIKKICDGCEELYSCIYCYDCSSFSCKECFEAIHSKYKKFLLHRKTENLNELITSSQTCKIHNKRFVYHCLTCNEYICINCLNSEFENIHENHKQEYICDFFPTKINDNISNLENLKIEEKLFDNILKKNYYLDKTDQKIKEINYFLKNQIDILEKLRISMINSLKDFKKDIVKNSKIISYIFENLYRDISNRELDKINFINIIFENERETLNSYNNDISKIESKNVFKNIIEIIIQNIEDNTILSNLPSIDTFKKEFEDYSNNLYFNFIKNSISHYKIEKSNMRITQYSLLNYLFNENDKIYFIFPNNINSNIYIIDLETKKEVFVLKYHEENINTLKIFRKDNKNYLITSSDDGIIIIWNLCEFFKEYYKSQNDGKFNENYINDDNNLKTSCNNRKDSETELLNENNKRFKVIDTEEENLVSFTIISFRDNFIEDIDMKNNKKKINFDHLICSYNNSTILIYDLYKINSPLKTIEFDYDVIIVSNYIDLFNNQIILIGESDLFIEIIKYEINFKEYKTNINIIPFKRYKKDEENRYFSKFIFYKIYTEEFIVYNDGLKIKFISLKNYELINTYILSNSFISSLYFLENDLLIYTSDTINFIKIDYFNFLKSIKNDNENCDVKYNQQIFKEINKLENNKKDIHSLSVAKRKIDNLNFYYLAIINGESTIKIYCL